MDAGTARELVTAVEEMVLISEEQAREVARSREEASRIEQMFQQKGKDRIAGKAAPNPSAELLSANDSQLSGQHSKHSRRETSFLNAFHGLMHLYSDPATRSSAERIFELLREIRMIEIGDDPSKLVFEMPRLSVPVEADTAEAGCLGLYWITKAVCMTSCRRGKKRMTSK